MGNYLSHLWVDLRDNKEIILLLSVIWVVLFEQISPLIVVSGVVLSVLVVVFTDRFLLKGNYEHSYMIAFGTFLKFGFRLVIEIYLAGMGVIPTIFSKTTDVQILTTETKLTDELLIDLLANSITLTPGTVTVDKKGSQLQILALNAPAEGEDFRELIPLRLEAILLDYEAKMKDKA